MIRKTTVPVEPVELPRLVAEPLHEQFVLALHPGERVEARALGLRVLVEELSDVRHDALLVGLRHVHVLGIEEPGDTELVLGHVEGRLEPDPVRGLPHRGYAHQVPLDRVDYAEERVAVPPALAEVAHVQAQVSAERRVSEFFVS